MSIYGNILLHFTEQMINVEYFQQIARVGSGYDPVGESSLIRVILQAGQGKEILGATGRLSQHAGWRTLAVTDKEAIWTVTPLVLGHYIRHPYNRKVMVIDKELDWAREAGFYAYTIEKVVGEDGSQTGSLVIEGGQF